MGIMSWFRGTASRDLEQKSSATAEVVVEQYGNATAVWSDRDIETFAEHVYKINSVGYRCVKMIAEAAAGVPLINMDVVTESAKPHPFLDLLASPSQGNDQEAFLTALYSFLLLAGNAYIEGVLSGKKEPLELWNLRPDRMSITPGSRGVPKDFVYTVAGRRVVWPVSQLDGRSKIVHIKEFHPLDDWYGMSRAEAAVYGINRHNSASAHNQATLQNGATPSGVLAYEPFSLDGKTVHAGAKEIEAAEAKLREKHSGPKNAGRPFVTNGKVNWQQMGVTPRDMDFQNGKDDAAWDICLAMGVPPVLAVKGESTYNNRREAKLELYEETVLPLVRRACSVLSHWANMHYAEPVTLQPDLDQISALEPRRELKRTSTVELLEKGVIDHQEAREALQYGDREADSVMSFDSAALTSLINLIPVAGVVPLGRYMRAVGLVPGTTSDADILAAALDSMEGDSSNVSANEDEDQDEEDLQENSEDV